ncbi:YfhH family protein [Brevibacillus sp. GCM10020057]|uniref:YfhH family protein n=1 Tax=Brevibacillus sp. GCM10020057 TaxID=3317327 RepID=UPI00363EE576
MRLYSQMTLAELQEEMERLRLQAEEKKNAGDESQFSIIQQKYFMAKSYYLGTDEFRIGGKYSVPEHDQPFTIDYFNGVFAWGRFPGSEEQTGFPVGMLEDWYG